MKFKDVEEEYELIKSVLETQSAEAGEDNDASSAYDYLHQSFWRIIHTLKHVPIKNGSSLLEVGSYPYFSTALCFHYIKELQYHGISMHDG